MTNELKPFLNKIIKLITDKGGATTRVTRTGATSKHTAKVRHLEQLTGNSYSDVASLYEKLNEVIFYINKK